MFIDVIRFYAGSTNIDSILTFDSNGQSLNLNLVNTAIIQNSASAQQQLGLTFQSSTLEFLYNLTSTTSSFISSTSTAISSNYFPINANFTIIILINIDQLFFFNYSCIHISIVYYSSFISFTYLNGYLIDENFLLHDLNNLFYFHYSDLNKIKYFETIVYDTALTSEQILNDYHLFTSTCLISVSSTSSSTSTTSTSNKCDCPDTSTPTPKLIANINVNNNSIIKKRSKKQKPECTSQCSNYCNTTCTSKCTSTTARLSSDNILQLSNTSCSCACDCACYSPPITTTTTSTSTTTIPDINLFPYYISEANQGKSRFNYLF